VISICLRHIATLAITASLLAGCAMPHRVAVSNTGAPQYKQIDISYRIPGSHRALVRDSSDVVKVSSADEAEPTVATLKIEYPHPDNKPELARATLRIAGKSSATDSPSLVNRVRSSISWLPGNEPPAKVRTTDDEVWIFDFPREQLDLMLFDLAQTGFFEDQTRHEGLAWLSIAIDRGRMAKTWTTEARLDDIVNRVQREGRRISR
jgi:hypothetical protein